MEKMLFKTTGERVSFSKSDFDGLKCLIIDDEPSVRENLEFLLKNYGIEVFSLDNGLKIIEELEKTNPDFLILDLVLNNFSGIKIIDLIRSNPKFLNIPILMLTGYSTVDKKVEAYNSGVDDFLEKPFFSYDMLLKIKSLIRRHNSKISKKLEHKGFSICLETLMVKYNNEKLNLSKFQSIILASLLKKEGDVVTISNLLSQFNGKMKKRTLDVHMAMIRSEFKRFNINLPESISGVGYSLTL